MINLFNIEIDPISLAPALFAVILSLYNYYKASNPANIVPTEIVNFGIISSSYEGAFKFVFPLVFHNEGAKKGVIKKIKIGFKSTGKEIKYFDELLKVRLQELTDDLAQLTDWAKFIEHGYLIINPTYPVSIESDSALDLVLVATCPIEESIVPLDEASEYVIEVYFGKNKVRKEFFPFSLHNDEIPDDRLVWLSPREN